MITRSGDGRATFCARSLFVALSVAAGLACAGSPPSPVAGSEAPAPTTARAPRVPWRGDLGWDAAVGLARGRGQPLLLNFTAAWCGPCKLFDVMVFNEGAVIAALADVLTLQIDLDHPGADELPRRFNVRSIPTLLWCAPDGTEIDRLVGYVSSERFLEIVADWRAGVGIDAGLARRLALRPESPALLFESARRLRGSGRDREAAVALRRVLNLASADSALMNDARRGLLDLESGPAAAATVTDTVTSGQGHP